MEDADSDSGFDSDGDWYHAGRDIVYGLRTNSNAVGPTEKEREAPRWWGRLSFVVKDRRLQGRLFESVSQKLAKS